MLTDNERELVRRVAEAEGITEEEAASNLVSGGLARRVKKRTGRTPAKVYQLVRQNTQKSSTRGK